jgi:hypothetical protein
MKSKEPKSSLPVPIKIEELRIRLQEWRQSRRQGTPIPPEIWGSATRLARKHGPGKVARLLGLDYYALRKRVEPDRATPRPQSPFIEVIPSMWAPGCECTVELEHPKGTRMRIQVKGGTEPDLEAITRLFLTGRP